MNIFFSTSTYDGRFVVVVEAATVGIWRHIFVTFSTEKKEWDTINYYHFHVALVRGIRRGNRLSLKILIEAAHAMVIIFTREIIRTEKM